MEKDVTGLKRFLSLLLIPLCLWMAGSSVFDALDVILYCHLPMSSLKLGMGALIAAL